jgi:hypothetical protein
MKRLYSKRLISITLILFCALSINLCLFADPGERFNRHQLHDSGGMPDHEGGESGGLAAFLLGVANFPVLLSLLLKSLARLLPDKIVKEKIKQLNLRQKKRLMKLHYWGNPLALGVAIAHFWSSACRNTAMPEMGIGAMLIVSVLGLMMTLKLSPRAMRSVVFKLHTSPVITILVFLFLLIGHSAIN